MTEWQVPALAVAAISDGEAMFLDSFGCRDLTRRLPATTRTLFPICSLTKSFTATGLVMLTDERRLDLDAPVRDYVPEFHLSDPAVTEGVAIRDLLSHRTGLPGHDWVHIPGNLSSERLLRILPHLATSSALRAEFQYQNLMYMVAGIVTERVAGMPWEAFIRTRILDPLGMANSAMSLEAMFHATDHAEPCLVTDGRQSAVIARPIAAIAAGGITASIEAMASYLRFHLSMGQCGGRQLISKAAIVSMQSSHIPVGRSPFDEIGEESYGLGFGIASYRGDKQVFHGGAWTGYSALLTMLPERGIGVVVLSNRHEHPACHILAYSILDALCGHERIPWRDRFRSIEEATKARRQDTDTPPIAPASEGQRSGRALTDYIGVYDHPAYGRIGIEANGCGLRFIGLSLNSPLHHQEGEIFELEDEPAIFLEGMTVMFRAGIAGDIDQISLPLEPKVPEIVFKRLRCD